VAGRYALLAVDDQLVLEKLREVAKELSLTIEHARSADETLRKAAAHPPAVVFLDLLSKRHRPLTLIRKLQAATGADKRARLVGFVAGNDALKHRAHALGCSFVYSRSELVKQAKSILRSLLA